MRALLAFCALLCVLAVTTPSAYAIVAPPDTPGNADAGLTPFTGEWAGDNWNSLIDTPVWRWSGTSMVSISADTVLMAGHCGPQVGQSVNVAGSGPFLITETDYSTTADLVVCKISKPQLRWAAPYGGPVNIGAHVEMIGCGYSGTCYSTYYEANVATSRVKRWCSNSIDGAGSILVMNYHAGDTEFEGGLAGSDSGSGTFIKSGNSWRTVGVNTSIDNSDQTHVSYAVNLADPAIYQWLIPLTTLPGDTNFDNKVDFSDYLNLEANFGKTSGADYCSGDFNFDGQVTFADYLKLEANFGKNQLPVPEPSMLGLLALSLPWICRRSKQA